MMDRIMSKFFFQQHDLARTLSASRLDTNRDRDRDTDTDSDDNNIILTTNDNEKNHNNHNNHNNNNLNNHNENSNSSSHSSIGQNDDSSGGDKERRLPGWQLTCKFTRSEVQSHSTLDDCWVVIFDKVYDITEFVYEHPGGDFILLEYAGLDATHPFLSTRHGSSAYKMLDKYWIGILVDEELYYSNNSSYCSVYSNLSWRQNIASSTSSTSTSTSASSSEATPKSFTASISTSSSPLSSPLASPSSSPPTSTSVMSSASANAFQDATTSDR